MWAHRHKREDGFALIELLVVIISIGIIAAIAIPAFLNQRQKGNDADAKATLRTAATALHARAISEGFFGPSKGSTGAVQAALSAEETSLKSAVDAGRLTIEGGDKYYLAKYVSQSGTAFVVTKDAPGLPADRIYRVCDKPGSGGCTPGTSVNTGSAGTMSGKW